MRKTKTILLFFSIFLSCFILTIPTNIVLASAVNYTIENWDSYTVGATSGTGTHGAWESDSSKFQVTNTWAYSGTNSLRGLKPTGNNAWYNITTDFEYISTITLYGYFHYTEGINTDTADHYIYTKNDTIEVNKIYISGTTSSAVCDARFYVYDYDNTQYTLWLVDNIENSISFYWKLIITHTSLNLFNYSLYYNTNNTYIDGVDISGRNAFTHTTIDQLLFNLDGTYNHGSSTNTFYIDDILVTTDSITGDMSEYSKKGETTGATHLEYVDDRYLEQMYWNKFEGTINAVDLVVNHQQYDDDPTLTNYQLKINGDNKGNPDYFFMHIDIWGSQSYILRWTNLNYQKSSVYILLEFYHSYKQPGQTFYWWVYSRDIDLNRDLKVEHSEHDNAHYFNGIFDGHIYSRDLLHAFYFSSVPEPETKRGFDDVITINTGEHIQYENVYLTWTISDLNYTYNNYITIYHETHGQVGQNQSFGGLGQRLLTKDGTIGFIPFYAGEYKANLWRSADDNITSINFTVEPNNNNFIIFVRESPVYEDTTYTICYLYNHLENNNGSIYISKTTDKNDGEIIKFIETNGYGEFQHSDTSRKTLYLILTVKVFTGYYESVAHYRLDIITFGIYPYIEVGKSQLKLHHNRDDYIQITGQHRHIGADVYVMLNDEIIKNVGLLSDFSFFTPIHNEGRYKASLVINSVNGTIELASAYFNASYVDKAFEKPLLPDLDPVLDAILGTIVTMVFLLLPMLISFSFKKSAKDIPPIIFAFSGGLGIVISVSFGFFGIWVPFFMVTIGIIVTVLMWIRKG